MRARFLSLFSMLLLLSSCGGDATADGDAAGQDGVTQDTTNRDGSADVNGAGDVADDDSTVEPETAQPDVPLPDPVWTRYDMPAPSDVTAIWAAASNDVWFGAMSRVSHWDGSSFTETQLMVGNQVEEIHGLAADNVWLVTQHSVHHYDGTEWSKVDASVGNGNLYAVWVSPSGKVWVGGTGGTLRVKEGDNWVDAHTGDLGAIGIETLWGTSDSDVWAGGATAIKHFDGEKWTTKAAISLGGWVASPRDLWSSAPDKVWAVGQNGQILHYDGIQFTQLEGDKYGPDFTKVWGTTPEDIWVVGPAGVRHSDGLHWWTIEDDFQAQMLAVGGVAPDDLWLAGKGGVAWRFARPVQ